MLKKLEHLEKFIELQSYLCSYRRKLTFIFVQNENKIYMYKVVIFTVMLRKKFQE